jgi:phosphoglycolate phosphatase
VKPVVLWDIDLTLVKTNGAGRAAMDQALGERFGVAAPTAGIRFDGRTDRGIFTQVIELLRPGAGTDEELFTAIVARYLELLPANIEAKGGIVFPGVPKALAAFAAAGGVSGLATGNIREGARAKLSYFGLWDAFTGGGFGDHTAIRAELVRAAVDDICAAAGLSPAEARPIVVGDTPLDVEAAHLAGIPALAVGTGSFTVEALLAAGADYALPDLSATGRVIEILTG